jgi:hypothetical protein
MTGSAQHAQAAARAPPYRARAVSRANRLHIFSVAWAFATARCAAYRAQKHVARADGNQAAERKREFHDAL